MVPALRDLSVFLPLPKRRWVPSWKHRQAQGSKFKDKRMSFVSHVPQRASNKKRFESLIRLFNLLSSFFLPLPPNIPSDRPHSQKPLGSPHPPKISPPLPTPNQLLLPLLLFIFILCTLHYFITFAKPSSHLSLQGKLRPAIYSFCALAPQV